MKMPEVQMIMGWPKGPDEAVIDVIRSGAGDSEWKSYRWLIVKPETGSPYFLGQWTKPDYGHHTDWLPPWEFPKGSAG
jgi:hypothetical protein